MANQVKSWKERTYYTVVHHHDGHSFLSSVLKDTRKGAEDLRDYREHDHPVEVVELVVKS